MNALVNTIRFFRTSCIKYSKKSELPSEVVVFSDKNMIICWHPEQHVPYEYTEPILEKQEMSNTVLKVGQKEITEAFWRKRSEFAVDELAKLTYTTKHRWYPKSKNTRFRYITEVDRPYL